MFGCTGSACRYELGVDDLRIAGLEELRGGGAVVALTGEVELADAAVGLLAVGVGVAEDNGALVAELQIDARREAVEDARAWQRLGEGELSLVGRVEDLGVDDGVALVAVAIEVDEEGGVLVERAVEVAVELEGMVGGLAVGEGILGVEGGVVAEEDHVAVELVGAGLGEDFDHAAAGVGVVAGGVGVLIDADLADGVLGRQASIGEAVDVHRGRVAAGDGLKFLLQEAGLGGQIVQVATLEDDRVAVLVGVGCVRRIAGDVDLELLRLDAEVDVDGRGFGRGDGERLALEDGEACGGDADGVGSRRDVGEGVVAVAGGQGGLRGPG